MVTVRTAWKVAMLRCRRFCRTAEAVAQGTAYPLGLPVRSLGFFLALGNFRVMAAQGDYPHDSKDGRRSHGDCHDGVDIGTKLTQDDDADGNAHHGSMTVNPAMTRSGGPLE